MARAPLVLLVVAACSSKSADDPAAPLPVARPKVVPADAAAPADGITVIGTFDAASGMHLDEAATGSGSDHDTPRRTGKPIDIVLKSTPPGAIASVDGNPIGPTPTYWPQGEADGREHEFTFVLRGFATARYRFVPIASGVVHARLEAIVEDRPDAGVP